MLDILRKIVVSNRFDSGDLNAMNFRSLTWLGPSL